MPLYILMFGDGASLVPPI